MIVGLILLSSCTVNKYYVSKCESHQRCFSLGDSVKTHKNGWVTYPNTKVNFKNISDYITTAEIRYYRLDTSALVFKGKLLPLPTHIYTP